MGLSKEQEIYFKDSKVRDKNGNLLVCYHGTDSNFKVFSKGDIGFHFGTEKAASERGSIKTKQNDKKWHICGYYLNIKKPLIVKDDVFIWSPEMIAFYLIYNNFWGFDFINKINFDVEDLKKKFPESVITNELEQKYKNKYEGDCDFYTILDEHQLYLSELPPHTRDDKVKYIVDLFKASGYDGIKYINDYEDVGSYSYIVFEPNQIKSVDNLNPTSSNNIDEAFIDDVHYDVKFQDLDLDKLESEILDSMNDYDNEYFDDDEWHVPNYEYIDRGFIIRDGSEIDTGGTRHYNLESKIRNWLVFDKHVDLSVLNNTVVHKITNALGWIRVNGYNEDYICLPTKRPNDTQLHTLEKWIDDFFRERNYQAGLRVTVGDGRQQVTYAPELTGKEIVDKIKRFYVSDVLTEDEQNEKLWTTKSYSYTSWDGQQKSYTRDEYAPEKDSKYIRLKNKPINTLTIDEIKYIYAIWWAWYMAQAKFFDSAEDALKDTDDIDFEECYDFLHNLSFPLTIYRAIRVGNYKSSELNSETNELIVSGKQRSYSWTTNINIYKHERSKFKNENTIVKAEIDSSVIDVPNTIQNFIFYTSHNNNNYNFTNEYNLYGEYEITLKKNFKQSDLHNLEFIDKNKVEALIESLLLEKNRQELINKSKAGAEYTSKARRGQNRWTRRKYSSVANSIRDYNNINMDIFFKDDILEFVVKVHGETDDYEVTITFSDILRNLQQEIERNNNKLEFKCVLRALLTSFNSKDLFVSCTCPDFVYSGFNYYGVKQNYNSKPILGKALQAPRIKNPLDNKGSCCKHINLVISNTDWMMKVASVINNYIKWCKDNMSRNYADIIFPAVYGVSYKGAIQMSLFDDPNDNGLLKSDQNTISQVIDKTMKARDAKGKFVQGNEYRFKKQDTIKSKQQSPEDNEGQLKLDLDTIKKKSRQDTIKRKQIVPEVEITDETEIKEK